MPVPTEAEALSVLAELRRTIDPETSKPFEAENSRADPAYIRAALAVQRSHPEAQKSNGEPNYHGAARMCIKPEKLHASVSKLVQRWVAKLERLEHVRRQSTLFTDLGQMEDGDLGQMAPEELLSLGAPKAARRDPTATKFSRSASAAAAAPCPFLELGHDEVGVVARELCRDPLRPLLAVALGSTAKGLRAAMQVPLQELRQRHKEAKALATHLGMWGGGGDLSSLRSATALRLGCSYEAPLTLAHWRTLGHLLGSRSLPLLEQLDIHEQGRGDPTGMIEELYDGDECVALLAAGLCRGGLPSLKYLRLAHTQIGPSGSFALAPALCRSVLPSLEELNLCNNKIDDAGLAALAPALRQLPKLKELWLHFNEVGSRGLACLLAEHLPPECWPTKPSAGLPKGCIRGVLPSLEQLHLSVNYLAGEDCDAVMYAVCIGAMPALQHVHMEGCDASEGAREIMDELLQRGDLFLECEAALSSGRPEGCCRGCIVYSDV